MLMFLVPIFVGIFDDLGGDLPMLTQIVVKGSNILRSYWYIVFPIWAGIIFTFLRFKKTESGRRMWDRFRMKMPFGIGAIIVKIGMARFSRTLSIHRLVQVHGGERGEAVRVLLDPGRDLVVGDQRAAGSVPRAEQPEADAGGVHGGDRDVDRGRLLGDRVAGPAAQRVEHVVREEARRRVLHPHVDRHPR